MSNTSEQPANENSHKGSGRPSPSPNRSLNPLPNVKALVNTWERPALEPENVEPPKPKHDLREEYKDPWLRQREERQRQDLVRKGAGSLRPDLKQLWQQQQAGNAAQSTSGRDRSRITVERIRESDGSPDHEGTGTAGNAPKLHPLSTPLPRASLNLPNESSTILPSGKTAFDWAFEPFLQAHPEYRKYLVPTTPSTSRSSIPSIGSSIDSGEVSVRTEDAFPSIPLENMTYYLRGKDEVATRLKILHVKQLLLRSSTLWRTAHILEHIERRAGEEGTTRKDWYRAYSKAGRTAEVAELLARDLEIDGLQARAWYWKGRADAGRRYWDDAVVAFRQADSYDVAREQDQAGGDGDYGGHGLTPFERKDIEWLRSESERRNGIAQKKRTKSAWARHDQRYDNLEHGTQGTSDVEEELEEQELDLEEDVEDDDEEEEEEAENQPLDVEGEELTEGFVNVAKEYPEFVKGIEKLKARKKPWWFAPFTKEEQHYIVEGTRDERSGSSAELGHEADNEE